jgi:long-chain acyl-CoA synthetase
MLGYYKDEEATAAVFTPDGYFRTGDLGYLDKDNYLFITGRKKNLILGSNGKNIFPEEIEEHLSHCELIEESVVVGRTGQNGELVLTAIIYPNQELSAGQDDDALLAKLKEEIRTINQKLPVYKQIRDVELRKDPFEKTTTRKIKRYLVKSTPFGGTYYV